MVNASSQYYICGSPPPYTWENLEHTADKLQSAATSFESTEPCMEYRVAQWHRFQSSQESRTKVSAYFLIFFILFSMLSTQFILSVSCSWLYYSPLNLLKCYKLYLINLLFIEVLKNYYYLRILLNAYIHYLKFFLNIHVFKKLFNLKLYIYIIISTNVFNILKFLTINLNII